MRVHWSCTEDGLGDSLGRYYMQCGIAEVWWEITTWEVDVPM